jgi:hypothetical protein
MTMVVGRITFPWPVAAGCQTGASFDLVVSAEVLMLPGHFYKEKIEDWRGKCFFLAGEGGLVGEDSVVQLARLVAASPHLMFHTFFFLLTCGCLSKRRSNILDTLKPISKCCI